VKLFGDRTTFAIEVGANDARHPSTRTVDIWIDGRSMSCDDNTVYVPQFQHLIGLDLARVLNESFVFAPYNCKDPTEIHHRLRSDATDLPEQYWFLHCGPTTDNMATYLFKCEEGLVITSEFWRPTHRPANEIGLIFQTKLKVNDLIRTLDQTIDALSS
jgi:hypothetical protein